MTNGEEYARMSEFVEWMKRRELSDRTVSNNQTYVSKCAECLKRSLDYIVSDDRLMIDAIKELAENLNVAEMSKQCYIGGFLKYYQFKNGKQFYGKVSAKCCHWYQEIIVDEVVQFLDVVRKLNKRNGANAYDKWSWAFRGQGEALWGLESSLGRVAGCQDQDRLTGDKLKMFEREAMWLFRREVSHHPEYRDFEGVDLLALMQHYGCKTRLLDFTMTPLLALFMALEQNDQLYLEGKEYAIKHLKTAIGNCSRPDFAVWVVDLNLFCEKERDPKFATESCRQRTVEEIWAEADEIIRAKENGNELGVKVVFPSKCNKRISAQDGLFLMATNLSQSFEANLRQALPELANDDNVPVMLSSLAEGKIENIPSVCKFVFNHSLRDEVKSYLSQVNITAKAVYPDLVGLGRFVSDIIQEHRQG